MEQYITLLQDGLAAIGIWFVVAALFIENIPIVGFIAPGLSILILSGFFHDLIVPHPGYLYVIAWITVILADNLWYWLGYFYGHKSQWLQKIAAKSPNVEELLTKQPVWALVTYQFMAYFRMFLPFSLGLYRFNSHHWLAINALASALFVALFISIGVIGAEILKNLAGVNQITTYINRILVIFAIIYGILLLRRYHTLNKR